MVIAHGQPMKTNDKSAGELMPSISRSSSASRASCIEVTKSIDHLGNKYLPTLNHPSLVKVTHTNISSQRQFIL